eukprot:8119142-Prorocentrum_lima.AAC.1
MKGVEARSPSVKEASPEESSPRSPAKRHDRSPVSRGHRLGSGFPGDDPMPDSCGLCVNKAIGQCMQC